MKDGDQMISIEEFTQYCSSVPEVKSWITAMEVDPEEEEVKLGYYISYFICNNFRRGIRKSARIFYLYKILSQN